MWWGIVEKSGKLPMFIGEYQYAIDEKGRFAIPAKFRSSLQTGAVVTKGLDGCLVLYPESEWKTLADTLAALPLTKAGTRAFARLMLAGAMDTKLDKQGRMMIPDYLRQYAGMKKRIVVVGMYTRCELWDEDRWERYKKHTEKEREEIAEKLGEFGI